MAEERTIEVVDDAIASYLGAALIVLQRGDFKLAGDLLEKASACCDLRTKLRDGSECAPTGSNENAGHQP